MIKHVSMLRNSYQAFGGSLTKSIRHRFKRAGSLRRDLGVALEERQMSVVLLTRQGGSILSSLADRVTTENDEMQQLVQLSGMLAEYEQRAPLNSVTVAIAGTRVLREPFDVPAGVSARHVERFAASRAEQLGRQLGVEVCHDFYLLADDASANLKRGVLIVCRRNSLNAVASAVSRVTSAALRVVPESVALASMALYLEHDWLCWRRGRCHELITDRATESFFITARDDSAEQEQLSIAALLNQAGAVESERVIRLAGEPLRCSLSHLSQVTGQRFAPLAMTRTLGMATRCAALDDSFVVPFALANDAVSVPSLMIGTAQ